MSQDFYNNPEKPKVALKVRAAGEEFVKSGGTLQDLIDAGYVPTKDDRVDVVATGVPTRKMLLGSPIVPPIGATNLDREHINVAISAVLQDIGLRRLGVEANRPGKPNEEFPTGDDPLLKILEINEDLLKSSAEHYKISETKTYEEIPIPEYRFGDPNIGRGKQTFFPFGDR